MDLNLVVLAGSLSAEPEHRQFDSGSSLLRLLVTVRDDEPRKRVDVVPVTVWDPSDELLGLQKGERIWAAGTVQRRFWETPDGRRSRLEVVADVVTVRVLEDHVE